MMFNNKKKTKKKKRTQVLKVSKKELKKYDFEKKFIEEMPVEEVIYKPININSIIWADVCDDVDEVEEPQVDNVLLKGTTMNVKKDLDEYFVRNSDELKNSIKKKNKKSKKSRTSKFNNYYEYKNVKFHTPSELLEYIERNPKNAEKVSSYVLEDDFFFTWLGQNSYHFMESIKEFRLFKKNIEKS